MATQNFPDEDQKCHNVQLLRDTFRIILNPEWAKSPQAIKCHTRITLKRVRENLHKQGHLILLCEATEKIIDKPWTYEELRQVLTGREAVTPDEAVRFCNGEGPVVLLLRLQWLSSSSDKSLISLALRLAGTCIEAIRAEDSTFRDSCTDLELCIFEDVFFLLLSELDLDRLCRELTSRSLELSVHITRRILHRFQSSLERVSCDNSSQEDVIQSFTRFWQQSWGRLVALIEHLLLRAMVEKQLHPDLSEVVSMYTWSQLTCGMTGQEMVERFMSLTNIYEKSVEQVYAICDGMFQAGGNQVRSFTLKHYILAMTVDLNRHNDFEYAGDTESARQQEIVLASLFMQVAQMVRDQTLIFKDCVRAAFLLNPTEDLLQLMYLLEGKKRVVTCGCDKLDLTARHAIQLPVEVAAETMQAGDESFVVSSEEIVTKSSCLEPHEQIEINTDQASEACVNTLDKLDSVEKLELSPAQAEVEDSSLVVSSNSLESLNDRLKCTVEENGMDSFVNPLSEVRSETSLGSICDKQENIEASTQENVRVSKNICPVCRELRVVRECSQSYLHDLKECECFIPRVELLQIESSESVLPLRNDGGDSNSQVDSNASPSKAEGPDQDFIVGLQDVGRDLNSQVTDLNSSLAESQEGPGQNSFMVQNVGGGDLNLQISDSNASQLKIVPEEDSPTGGLQNIGEGNLNSKISNSNSDASGAPDQPSMDGNTDNILRESVVPRVLITDPEAALAVLFGEVDTKPNAGCHPTSQSQKATSEAFLSLGSFVNKEEGRCGISDVTNRMTFKIPDHDEEFCNSVSAVMEDSEEDSVERKLAAIFSDDPVCPYEKQATQGENDLARQENSCSSKVDESLGDSDKEIVNTSTISKEPVETLETVSSEKSVGKAVIEEGSSVQQKELFPLEPEQNSNSETTEISHREESSRSDQIEPSSDLPEAILRLPDSETLEQVSRGIGSFTANTSYYCEQLGLTESTLSSLYNILEYGRRYDFSRETPAFLQKCEEYYQDPDNYKKIIKELSYRQLHREKLVESDGESDIYAGIEKGYEKYLHEDEEASEELSQPVVEKPQKKKETKAYLDFDMNELYESDEKNVFKQKRKIVKRKKLKEDEADHDFVLEKKKKPKKKIKALPEVTLSKVDENTKDQCELSVPKLKKVKKEEQVKVAKVDATRYRAHLILERIIPETVALKKIESELKEFSQSNIETEEIHDPGWMDGSVFLSPNSLDSSCSLECGPDSSTGVTSQKDDAVSTSTLCCKFSKKDCIDLGSCVCAEPKLVLHRTPVKCESGSVFLNKSDENRNHLHTEKKKKLLKTKSKSIHPLGSRSATVKKVIQFDVKKETKKIVPIPDIESELSDFSSGFQKKSLVSTIAQPQVHHLASEEDDMKKIFHKLQQAKKYHSALIEKRSMPSFDDEFSHLGHNEKGSDKEVSVPKVKKVIAPSPSAFEAKREAFVAEKKEREPRLEDELADFSPESQGNRKPDIIDRIKALLLNGRCPPDKKQKLETLISGRLASAARSEAIIADLLHPRNMLPSHQEHVVNMVQIPREAPTGTSNSLSSSAGVSQGGTAEIQASVPQPIRSQARPVNLQQVRAVVTATTTHKPSDNGSPVVQSSGVQSSVPVIHKNSAVRSQSVLRTATQTVSKVKVTTHAPVRAVAVNQPDDGRPSTSHGIVPVVRTISLSSQPKNEMAPATDRPPQIAANRLQAHTSPGATTQTCGSRTKPVEAHRSEPNLLHGLAVPKTGARQNLKLQKYKESQNPSSQRLPATASLTTPSSSSLVNRVAGSTVTAVKSTPATRVRQEQLVIPTVRQVVLPQAARAITELKSYPSSKEVKKNLSQTDFDLEEREQKSEAVEATSQPLLPKFNQVFGKKPTFEQEPSSSNLEEAESGENRTLPSVDTLLRSTRFSGVPTVQKVIVNTPVFRTSHSLDSPSNNQPSVNGPRKSPSSEPALRRSESATLSLSSDTKFRSDVSLESTLDHFSEQLKEFETVYEMVANGTSNLPLSQQDSPSLESSYSQPSQQFGNIDYTDYSSAESFTSSVSISASNQITSGLDTPMPLSQTPDDQRSDSSLTEIKVESASPSPVLQVRERNVQSRYVIVPGIPGISSVFTIQGAPKPIVATKSSPDVQVVAHRPTTPKATEQRCKSKSPVKASVSAATTAIRVPQGISPPKVQPKPADDHDTVLRVQQILEEYTAQVQKSPDLVNKPAPRRRSNPPPSPNHTSKRRKQSPTKVKLLSEHSKQNDSDGSSRPGTACGMNSQPKTVIDLTETSPTPPEGEDPPLATSSSQFQVVKPLIVTSGQPGSVRMFLDPSALTNMAGRNQRLVLSPVRGLKMLTLRGQQGVVGVPLQGQTFQIRLCQPSTVKVAPDPALSTISESEEVQQLPDGVLPDVDAFLAEGKSGDAQKKEIFVGFEDMINYQLADSHFQQDSPQRDIKPTLVIGSDGEMRAVEPQSQVLHAYNNHGKYEPLTLFRGEEEEPSSSDPKRPRLRPDTGSGNS